MGPQGVYGWSKLLGERLLCEQADRLGDCESVSARLFNVYGPGDPHSHLLPEILRQARRGRVLPLGDLGEARDFVYVDDVAEALVILLCRAQPGVVNVGTGTAVSGRELVDLVTNLTGRSLGTRVGCGPAPAALASGVLRCCGTLARDRAVVAAHAAARGRP